MKNTILKTGIITIVMAALFAGCAGNTHIEKDDNVDIRNYNSFVWLHGDKNKLNDRSDLIEAKIRSAISEELRKSGWREVKQKPDVILDYDLLVEKGSREKNEARYSRPFTRLIYNPYTRRYVAIYYPSRFLGYESYEEIIKEGTVTITMIDAKTDKVVWQGWTTDELNSSNPTSKEVQKAVAQIFKKSGLAKR